MFRGKKAYSITVVRGALVIGAALVMAGFAKIDAHAQENQLPADRRRDDNHGVVYDRDYHDGNDRGNFRDGYYPHARQLQHGKGYRVDNIENNPQAYGAVIRYLDDDWDKKYLFWATGAFNKQEQRPLVISLHGNDEGIESAFARLYNSINQYNYAFVALKWESGDKFMAPAELSAFIGGIITELREKEGLNVDTSRLILHGYERGANMAGYLDYFNPGKYLMTIVDSGPFPAITSVPAAGTAPPGKALTIPSDELNKLAGSYIYLYSRFEDQSMYNRLEASMQSLVAAGANAELNYTKGLLAGDFSDALGKSIVDMYDKATGKKQGGQNPADSGK